MKKLPVKLRKKMSLRNQKLRDINKNKITTKK